MKKYFECKNCNHFQVCKHTEKLEETAKTVENYLNKIDYPQSMKFYIECDAYCRNLSSQK